MTDRRLIDEQIAYYRARAAEYDATSQPPGDPLAERVKNCWVGEAEHLCADDDLPGGMGCQSHDAVQ